MNNAMSESDDDDVATTIESLEPIAKLSKDLREAAKTMGKVEIRFLVDGYYALQDYRKAANNQVRAAEEAKEPASVLKYIAKQAKNLEGQIKGALDKWTMAQKIGAWCRSHVGIGPVITSGLLAHIDITKAPTAGHIYSFAGLNPEASWIGKEGSEKLVKEVVGSEKEVTEEFLQMLALKSHRNVNALRNQARDEETSKITRASLTAALAKRPWNANLKTLIWKMGDSFCKFHNHKDCFYGHLYAERKVQEVQRNTSGQFAETAKHTLEIKAIKDKDTRAKYESGLLPDGRIDLRARRYAEKIFLSHLHLVMYWDKFGKMPPVPFSFTKSGGDHAHYIAPPNLDMFAGLGEAVKQQYGV